MIKEIFLGRPISHFHMNDLVKAFIISESFFWSAWNFVLPIFSVFVTSRIPGGNVQIAGTLFSVYLISRVVFELTSGRLLATASERKKIIVTTVGIFILSLAYIGFANSTTLTHIFIYSILTGMGFGIATPAKNATFSTHLDKNKETLEWGLHDASVFVGMALSAALGGFIANAYGFPLLFYISAVINIGSMIPYFIYLSMKKS